MTTESTDGRNIKYFTKNGEEKSRNTEHQVRQEKMVAQSKLPIVCVVWQKLKNSHFTKTQYISDGFFDSERTLSAWIGYPRKSLKRWSRNVRIDHNSLYTLLFGDNYSQFDVKSLFSLWNMINLLSFVFCTWHFYGTWVFMVVWDLHVKTIIVVDCQWTVMWNQPERAL